VDQHRASWIIFDSLIRFTRRSLKDAEPMSDLYLTRFRPLLGMVDGGLLILAHRRKHSKEAPNDPGHSLYGSVDIRNSADAHLAPERTADAVRVTHEATRWDDPFPSFLLRLERSEDRSSAKLVYVGETDVKSAIKAWLRNAGAGGMLRQEIVT